MNDTIGIDVESHFDLRDTAWRYRNSNQIELSQQLVIGRHLPLSLEYANGHSGLVVLGRGKDLAFLCRYSGVALNQFCKYAAKGLDPQREGCDIEKQNILDLTLQNGSLDRGTYGNNLIRVDALVGIFAEDLS